MEKICTKFKIYNAQTNTYESIVSKLEQRNSGCLKAHKCVKVSQSDVFMITTKDYIIFLEAKLLLLTLLYIYESNAYASVLTLHF